MPTESTFLLAGLLFLAAALGYFFARFGDDEEDDVFLPSSRLNADYIKGLNYLLNEQPDQALEVFMRMVEVDDETLETHFALGSLFRRRGEVDRAIRVHQNLIARPDLSAMHRENALIALAEDYLSAGLFDRAEALFKELRSSTEFKVKALEKLVRIYEVTHDWEPAIEACSELEKMAPPRQATGRVAHYYCELAEEALQRKDFVKARDYLGQASANRNSTVRALYTLASVAQESGNHDEAIELFCKVMQQQPRLITEVVPRLTASCDASHQQNVLTSILEDVRSRGPEASQAIALATINNRRIDNPVALQCLLDYVVADRVLAKLVSVEQLQNVDPVAHRAAIDKIREGLAQMFSPAHRYRCKECGYHTSQLVWQCPSCRAWESVAPAVQLNFAH
jgi:lipopolysaccharide biosynthesis regulator YciM